VAILGRETVAGTSAVLKISRNARFGRGTK
jgi:hypothetical protein